MAKKAKEPGKVVEPEAAAAAGGAGGPPITLTAAYSKKARWIRFQQWLCGTSPLICHAWSEKAKREMLAKMVKAVKVTKEERKPEQEFNDSLYELAKGQYGFPVTAVKKAIIGQAHKDKGIPKTTVMSALWLDYEMVQARPALAGAICDMPIVRLWASPPVMREDMVRIKGARGSTANFAYRAQFTHWAIKLTGKFDPNQLPADVISFLVEGAGIATGLGDWRNEKSGIFGAFRLVDDPDEIAAWERFAAGKGRMPVSPDLRQAAE